MNTELLKSKLLEAAIQGKLVPQDPNDEPASVLLARIGVKESLRTDDISFDIPKSWCWVKLKDIANVELGKTLDSEKNRGDYYNYLCAMNVKWYSFELSTIKQLKLEEKEKERYSIRKGDLLICEGGDVGRSAIWEEEKEIYYQNALHRVRFKDNINNYFFLHILKCYKDLGLIDKVSGGMTIKHFTQKSIQKLVFPLPPLAEQRRIVATLEEGFAAIDAIAEAKENLSTTAEMLRSKILQAAFEGTLTGEDFTKCLVQLGNVSDIARGGSPRPIKQYITTAANGVNWIKIGDTEKGGKYINSCKEKIKPEGVKRSREVHKGDFLLTNSMSFGRPYITNIDGCIHDGWLVISPHDNTFDKDFLFYLLSSSYVYAQFCDKATGSTVSNLNIDRVKATSVPMPSISEQQRIVAKIEELFAEIDKLTK